ncbi:hypothetical protein [Nocardioides pantholopis]|uniref:hypothetical protein n=1 Tax=Nocardioides pantholopis TaxID=2483798 RepID=UPI000FDCDCAF|nr:hypothetical protein [Nocardioides pantholopis]
MTLPRTTRAPRVPRPRDLLRPVLAWPVTAQATACRNALGATTVLARERAEREEVEALLAALHAERARA